MSLPSGYTQLEYIESTGTQYISTGITPTENTKVVIEFNSSSSSGVVFGQDSGYKVNAFMFAMTVVVFESTKKNISISANAKHTVQVAPKAFKVDNGSSQYIYANKVNAAYPMFLFGNNRNGKFSEGVAMKLYSFKVYENNVLIADFIPCRNDNTTGIYVGAIGLWDDVNSLFYTNIGTGTFIAGELPTGTHKTLVNGTAYEVTGGKCMVDGTVYSIKKGRTLIGGTGYDITFAPAYDPVFANNTWEQIIAACHNNEVPDTWKVADHKPMTINGVDYQIDIIGKNHDTYSDGSGKAPLTFQLHDCYGETKTMNSSSTNNGGWTRCAMRQTHLPVILAKMPTEVQNGIREVNKLTSAGSQSATINTTADKLFLLSEIEIFGSVFYSKSGEGTQYDYYKAGNSKVKNRNGSASDWCERSPHGTNYSLFCNVYSYGNAGYNSANFERGVAFGFCF